jgi:hypothetical protein
MSKTNKVYEFQKKNKEGFTSAELIELLKEYPDIDMKKYNNAMLCHTCPMIDGEIVFYTHDVAVAISCGIEKRDITQEEFD